MKSILAAVTLILLASAARAQQLTYQAPISSGVYSGVTVSTYQATEIDNWVKGVQGTTVPNRSGITFSLPGGKMNCAFDSAVSTQPASGNFGIEFEPNVVYNVPLPNNTPYWCLMQAQAAAQGIGVQQVTPWKPGTRGIP